MEKKMNSESASISPAEVALRALQEFREEMTDSVIPEIVRVIEERKVLALQSASNPLKT